MESFFDSMQIEPLERRNWHTRAELASASSHGSLRSANRIRRHSALGYLRLAHPQQRLPVTWPRTARRTSASTIPDRPRRPRPKPPNDPRPPRSRMSSRPLPWRPRSGSSPPLPPRLPDARHDSGDRVVGHFQGSHILGNLSVNSAGALSAVQDQDHGAGVGPDCPASVDIGRHGRTARCPLEPPRVQCRVGCPDSERCSGVWM